MAVATANKIKLEKTAASVAFENDYATINPVLARVEKYTGPVTLTDAGGVSATNLNTIAAATSGKVTATLNSVAVAPSLVTALADVKATDNISFSANNTALADNSDVRALIDLSRILPKANYDAIPSITSNEVSLVKQALTIIKKNAITAVDTVVTFSGSPISAKDANDIAKATDGILTATLKDGKVAETLKALGDVKATDALTFTTTDTSVKAADLVALSSKLAGGTLVATSVTKITGEAKDVASIAAAVVLVPGADVTVSGTITTADVATIQAAGGTGVLKANVQAAEADQLNSSLATSTDELNLVVNGQTALATDLNSLITKTAGTIKLEAKDVRGDVTALTALYDTNKASFIALGNENVTITGANPTAAELNKIAAATTGKVTATLIPTTTIDAATDALLKDVKATDVITFKTTDTNLVGKDDLNALLAIKKLIPNADFSAINVINADAKDVALVKNVLKDVAANVAVTITGTGDISAADANAIAKGTLGALTATIKDGSIAATLKALGNIDATVDELTFTTTDKSAKASDLVALNALIKTSANLNVATVKTLTGDAKDAASGDIASALAIIDTTPATNLTEVKISGNVDAADIGAIIGATAGKVTATLKADTASALVAALADANLPTGGNAINVTVDDTIITSAANLSIAAGISGLTSGKIKVDALQIDGAFADLNELYVTNKAQFTNLGNENVVISGATTALNVDAIAKATSGILTASVTNAAANVLVSQLKNANAKDALTITVLDNPAGTSAKDLLTLDGKTSETVVATAVTAISGTVAEIGKLAGADITLVGSEKYTISGTVKAADLSDIADTTAGAITATVAADTAEKLAYTLGANAKLMANVATNQINLKVTGATAAAADLVLLNGITAVNVQVDAKEVTGTAAKLGTAGTGLYALTTGFTGLADKNVKVTDTVAAATDAGLLSTILAGTKGVVTATTSGTVANLLTIANATSGKDALTFNISSLSATASDLLALDSKTSVKVDATALSVSGTAAQLKELAAAKGVQLAKDVAITVTGATNAADLAAVLKATTGVVKATVAADTASALNSALKDASSSDALTLSVNGVSAAAKDLISLNAKTYVPIKLTVGAITGNIAEITKVFVTDAAGFDSANLGAANATISGTVEASAVDAVALKTSGAVTATIKADTAAVLNSTLTDNVGTNAYTLKVTGTSAKAADLNGLDAKTSVAVDASAIKNIDGTAAAGATAVGDVVTAAQKGDISGLGNETVNLTGATDANATLVKAINDFTTGLITLPTITFDNGAATTFNLNAATLGDLSGITGLTKIDANNAIADTMSIKLSDLLAANDGSITAGNLAFLIKGNDASQDTLTFTNDLVTAGWTTTTGAAIATGGTYVFTHTASTNTLTVTVTDVNGAAVL